jgi:hypothetical protein
MSNDEFKELESKLQLKPSEIADELKRKQSTIYETWRKPRNKLWYEILLIGIYIKRSKLSIDELVSIIEPIKAIKNK